MEFYDAGTGDLLSINEVSIPDQQSAPAGEKPKVQVVLRGLLTRNPKKLMPLTAPGFSDLFYFAGTGLTTKYQPENTTLSEGEKDTLILEKFSEDKGTLFRTWVSKKFWRPLASEIVFIQNGRKGVYQKVASRVEAENYRQYPGDIWFPNVVTRSVASDTCGLSSSPRANPSSSTMTLTPTV